MKECHLSMDVAQIGFQNKIKFNEILFVFFIVIHVKALAVLLVNLLLFYI